MGAILAVINHGDKMISGSIAGGDIVKIILTFVVPYLVSTLSSVLAEIDRRSNEIDSGAVATEDWADIRARLFVKHGIDGAD